jgi:iron complex outermembrane recepter protein
MLKTLVAKGSLTAVACALSIAAHAIAGPPGNLNIPAGELIDALKSLATQSNIELVYQPEQLRELKTAGVKGAYSAQEAVSILLKGTSLKVYTTPSGAMVIATPTAPKQSSALPTQHSSIRLAQEYAAPREPDAAQSGSTQELEKLMLEEIVVTAQKRQERLIDTPMSVSVLSSNELQKIGATQFRDFADAVPGLSFNTTGAGNTQITLRGVSAGFDISPTVGVNVDEVPFGPSSAFGGGARLALDVGLFDMDRIEVLRGPQGTLYGASTMGGLLKYVSRVPSTDRFNTDVQVGLSTIGKGGVGYNGAAALNAPIVADKLALRVSGFYSHDGGYIDNLELGSNDVSQSNIYGGRADLLIAASDAFSVRLSAFAQNISRDGEITADYDRQTEAPVDGSLAQRRFFPEPFSQKFRLVSATATYDLGAATVTSISSYQTLWGRSVTDRTRFFIPGLQAFGLPYSIAAVEDEGSVYKFTQEVRLASDGERLIEWLVGGFYTSESSGEEGTQGLILRDLAGQPTTNILFTASAPTQLDEYAAFSNLTWNVNEKFDLSGGLRVSRNHLRNYQTQSGLLSANETTSVRAANNDVTTYLANARYHLTDRSMAYARFATGYRPGGPNFIVRDLNSGELLAPQTFDADRLKSYEVGLKAETSARTFGVDVTAYRIDWDNFQVSSSRNGIGVILNAPGGALVRGVELALTARPLNALTATAALAYQDAELAEADDDLGGRKGERLPGVPDFTATLAADYRLPIRSWQSGIGATVRHVSDRRASFDASASYPQWRLPEYTLVDLRAGFSLGSVDLQLYARNIFDKRGQLSVQTWRDALAQVSITQPRTIGILASTQF